MNISYEPKKIIVTIDDVDYEVAERTVETDKKLMEHNDRIASMSNFEANYDLVKILLGADAAKKIFPNGDKENVTRSYMIARGVDEAYQAEYQEIKDKELTNIAGTNFTGNVIEKLEEVKKAFDWVKEHSPEIIAALKGIGMALIAFSAFNTLSSIISSLANPITLIIALAGLFAAAWEANLGGIQEKFQAFLETIQKIKDKIHEVLYGPEDEVYGGKNAGISGYSAEGWKRYKESYQDEYDRLAYNFSAYQSGDMEATGEIAEETADKITAKQKTSGILDMPKGSFRFSGTGADFGTTDMAAEYAAQINTALEPSLQDIASNNDTQAEILQDMIDRVRNGELIDKSEAAEIFENAMRAMQFPPEIEAGMRTVIDGLSAANTMEGSTVGVIADSAESMLSLLADNNLLTKDVAEAAEEAADAAAAAAESGAGTGNAGTDNALEHNFNDLLGKYNTASGTEKDLLGYALQAMLDASMVNGQYSANAGSNRLLLTDLVNGEVNNETYNAAIAAMANGNYSEAIFDQMVNSYTETYLKKLEQGAITDEKYQNLFGNLSLTGTEGEAGAESGAGTLFELLFGNPELYEGLASVLNEETLGLLQQFLSTPIETTVTDSWALFSESLTATATALSSIMSLLSGGEEGELGDEELGSAFAEALIKMGEAAEKITPQLQQSLNPQLELMSNYLDIADSHLRAIKDLWAGDAWKGAVNKFVSDSGPAITTTNQLASAAASATSYYQAWAAAINAVIDALNRLGDAQGGNKSSGNNSGVSEGDNTPMTAAGGGSIFPYGTAIVGEHGPEIIRTGSSRLNVFANSQLMNEIDSARHALNLLSNSAALTFSRVFNGGSSESSSADYSQHFTNNFEGAIITEEGLKSRIEEIVGETIRKELVLAG